MHNTQQQQQQQHYQFHSDENFGEWITKKANSKLLIFRPPGKVQCTVHNITKHSTTAVTDIHLTTVMQCLLIPQKLKT